MRRHVSLMFFHLLWPVTYDQRMRFQNPLAQKLNTNRPRDSEKESFNRTTVSELRTKVYHVRKSVITSEPLVHLLRATAINPWPQGNLAPSLELARTTGTPRN